MHVIAPKAEWCAAVTLFLALWLSSVRLKADLNTNDKLLQDYCLKAQQVLLSFNC
jgi:hypothetical protein